MRHLRGPIAGLVLALICVALVEDPRAQEETFVPKSRDLFEMADELRGQGIYEHHLGTMMTLPAIQGYDELQDLCDVAVLATLVESRSRPAGGNTSIETVYRFHVDEVIMGSVRARNTGSHPPVPLSRRQVSVPGAPGFRLPARDEILIWRNGGMLRINGVTFKHQPTYAPFKRGNQYILFLKRSTPDDSGYYVNQRFTMLFPVAGPYGCVEVENGSSGRIRSLNESFNRHLEDDFFSDKDELLRHLRARASNRNQP